MEHGRQVLAGTAHEHGELIVRADRSAAPFSCSRTARLSDASLAARTCEVVGMDFRSAGGLKGLGTAGEASGVLVVKSSAGVFRLVLQSSKAPLLFVRLHHVPHRESDAQGKMGRIDLSDPRVDA